VDLRAPDKERKQTVNQTKPNIVFIMADDMGYGDLSCYGAEKIPTPNTERLAAEGMRFTDMHSSSAVCTPSRYSVITGRYCWRSKLKEGVLAGLDRPLIEQDRLTIAAFLKQQGYATACIGKWHLGLGWMKRDGTPLFTENDPIVNWEADGFDVDYRRPVYGGPTTLGFDYFFGIAGSLDMPPYCFIENDHTCGVPDREKEHYYNQQRRGMQTPDWRDEEVDTTFARKAVEFIERCATQSPRKPFFLYLPTASPHRPCDIAPDFVRGASQAGDRGDMVVLFDWVVGRVMEALDRLGIAGNTLLFVTSDNGGRLTCANGQDYGHRTNGPLRGQKADIWDGGHREPFIARWPGHIRPGSTCTQLACLADLFATCAAAAGAELPDNAAEDSFNLLPALLGESPSLIRPALVHHSVDGMFSIRRGPWKLCLGLGSGGFSEPRRVQPPPGGPQGQLYNLDEDLAETNNLWIHKPGVVKELTQLLETWQRDGRSR